MKSVKTMAESLEAHGKRKQIQVGLIVDIRVHYFTEVVEAIIEHAHNQPDFAIRIIEPTVAAMLAYPDRPHLDAIIAQPLAAAEYATLADMGLAVVNFSSRLRRQDGPADIAHVVADDHAIGIMAAEHLRRMGLRHFGFYGSRSLNYCHGRMAGFRDHLDQLPRRIPPSFDMRMEDGADALAWVRQMPLPCGIFAANDNHAKTVIVAATQAGLRVPEDIAVVGVDADTIQSQLSPVPIASVQPDATRLAQLALQAVSDIVAGRRAPHSINKKVAPVGVRYAGSAPLNHAADPIVAKALMWLEQNLAEPVQIEVLARIVGLSRRALEYRFRTQMDCAPYEKLLEMRLRKARELMLRTNRTINAIALDVGFSNQREFCVRFKQREGCTPTEFRSGSRPNKINSTVDR